MTDLPNSALLFLLDSNGIYIPQLFAQQVDREAVTGVTAEDWEILEAGPDGEHYWDTWSDVEGTATVTGMDGRVFNLYQDGDLWLIPIGAEWPE